MYVTSSVTKAVWEPPLRISDEPNLCRYRLLVKFRECCPLFSALLDESECCECVLLYGVHCGLCPLESFFLPERYRQDSCALSDSPIGPPSGAATRPAASRPGSASTPTRSPTRPFRRRRRNLKGGILIKTIWRFTRNCTIWTYGARTPSALALNGQPSAPSRFGRSRC